MIFSIAELNRSLFVCVMAQRWHPDKVANGRVDPARAEEAKARFQQIHEAYKGTIRYCSVLVSICTCFFLVGVSVD